MPNNVQKVLPNKGSRPLLVKVAEQPKASGISSRGGQALDRSEKIDAHACFTKSGQEPK
jgi:hypothetical protein